MAFVPPQDNLLTLLEAKNKYEASLEKKLAEAKVNYEKQLADIAAKYNVASASPTSFWHKIGLNTANFNTTLNRALFVKEQRELSEQYKKERSRIKIEHNKVYGQAIQELQEKLSKAIGTMNFEIKQITLKHGGEVIVEIKLPSEPFKETQPVIDQWLISMSRTKTQNLAEKIKQASEYHFSPKPLKKKAEKEFLGFLSDPIPLGESNVDSIPDLINRLDEHPQTMVIFTDNKEKNNIGILKDQDALWFYDPRGITACFPFANKEQTEVKEHFSQFIKNYQRALFPTTTHATIVTASKKKKATPAVPDLGPEVPALLISTPTPKANEKIDTPTASAKATKKKSPRKKQF